MLDFNCLRVLCADPGMQQTSPTTPNFVRELEEARGGKKMGQTGIYAVIDTTSETT